MGRLSNFVNRGVHQPHLLFDVAARAAAQFVPQVPNPLRF